MKVSKSVLAIALCLCGAGVVGLRGNAASQDGDLDLVLVGQVQGPPKPGPHHAHLKQLEGTWDATVQLSFSPDMPPQESKGTGTNVMSGGGLWLISHFKDEAGTFQGHGIFGYDPAKKKYVSVWVDSMQDYIAEFEGTCDGSGKTITMFSQRPDFTGKPAKFKDVTEIKEKNLYTYTMYSLAAEKETLVMKITYKRRK